jgi:predicted ATPase
VAFATVLSRVAAADRLVLVLDDLQWADRPTMQLVRDLVGRPGTAAVLVLAAYRSDEWTTQLDALDDLIDEGRKTSLALGGLAPADVAELAAELYDPSGFSAACIGKDEACFTEAVGAVSEALAA